MQMTNLTSTPLTLNEFSACLPIPEYSRMYYVDVYTGQSILSYESPEILNALSIVAQFAHPAQCISFYSYKQDPYKIRNYVQ